MMRTKSLLFGLVLAVASVSSAQLMPPGFKIPNMRYNPALLMNPDVQKDMHVSKEVGQKVLQIMMQEGMKMLPALMGAMGGKKQSPAEQQKTMSSVLQAYDTMQKKTIVYLTPAQRVRLHEITLQSTGASALMDPSVAAEVGLTPSQSARLASEIGRINRQDSAGMTNPFQGGGKFDAKSMNGMASRAAAMAKKTKADTDLAMNKILTPGQKAKWQKLQGRHIDLKGIAGMGNMFGGM